MVVLSPPPPPPPSSGRPHQSSVVRVSVAQLTESELNDWLLDAEELLSTCLTGIDVLLRLTAKHGIVPPPTLAECKKRLVGIVVFHSAIDGGLSLLMFCCCVDCC
jgi:hypothetical protein